MSNSGFFARQNKTRRSTWAMYDSSLIEPSWLLLLLLLVGLGFLIMRSLCKGRPRRFELRGDVGEEQHMEDIPPDRSSTKRKYTDTPSQQGRTHSTRANERREYIDQIHLGQYKSYIMKAALAKAKAMVKDPINPYELNAQARLIQDTWKNKSTPSGSEVGQLFSILRVIQEDDVDYYPKELSFLQN